MTENKADLNLIQMVQQARMMHDAQTKPSTVDAVYWIEAKNLTQNASQPTPRAGQWVLDTDLEHVDALWEIVRTATERGELGYKSKVSTASRSGESTESRTICVRTIDETDTVDVERVREALRSLGIAGDWRYESK